MYLSRIYILITVLFLLSCSDDYDVKRDKLIFKDSILDVQSALISVNKIMITENIKNYFFRKDDILFFNGTKIMKYDSTNVIKIEQKLVGQNLISKKYSKQFLKNIIFLKRNYIIGAYEHAFFKILFFSYRDVYDGEYHNFRDIILGDCENIVIPENKIETHILLDCKSNMLLLRPKALIDTPIPVDKLQELL